MSAWMAIAPIRRSEDFRCHLSQSTSTNVKTSLIAMSPVAVKNMMLRSRMIPEKHARAARFGDWIPNNLMTSKWATMTKKTYIDARERLTSRCPRTVPKGLVGSSENGIKLVIRWSRNTNRLCHTKTCFCQLNVRIDSGNSIDNKI